MLKRGQVIIQDFISAERDQVTLGPFLRKQLKSFFSKLEKVHLAPFCAKPTI